MTDRPIQHNGRNALWDDGADGVANASFKSLSREEVAVLRAQEPPVSPWRVVVAQAAVGVVAALIGWAVTGLAHVGWSLLYGAAAVVVPGALMVRGITRPVARASAGAGMASFFVWETVKVGLSVAMLVSAPALLQPVSWPALLAGLVLCLKCYGVALLWRGRKKN